uniref:Putative ovule protein n=1 Tax=Solanum chacoense TaxID=4108 RepID=A0A0V0HS91_SOLCH
MMEKEMRRKKKNPSLLPPAPPPCSVHRLSDMMDKKEVKQKVIKLPRNSNAASSGIFTCNEFEL